MELNNLNVNSVAVSWFFLTLFYKTGRKYTCTKEKILQLLTIVALDYACSGDKVFSEEILISDNYEPYIKGLLCSSKCEYIKSLEQNDNKRYIDEILDETKEDLVPFMYRCNVVDDELKEKAIDVFRNFGSYSQKELKAMISPIVNKLTTKDKVVDLIKTPYIINEIDTDNEVINYLKHKQLCEVNKNNKRLIKR